MSQDLSSILDGVQRDSPPGHRVDADGQPVAVVHAAQDGQDMLTGPCRVCREETHLIHLKQGAKAAAGDENLKTI